MNIREALSRENVLNNLKNLGKLRVRLSHHSILTFLPLLLILLIAFTIRMLPLRWELGKDTLYLSEFDPYFQYRFTEYIVKNGYISWAWPTPWYDTQRWYPHSINVATTGYPGLPFTAAFFYQIISALGVNIRLMDFCALLPPIMGMFACLAIYFLGKDFGGKTVGLLAALFLALSPSHIQRTSLGFFDDEIIGILALILFIFVFLKAIEEARPLLSSLKYAIGAGLILGYFCAGWGAAYYPIGLTVLFTIVLIILNRYTRKLLLTYSLTFGLGLFMAINVPRLSPNYLTTVAILPVAGGFMLLCLCEVLKAIKTTRSKFIAAIIFIALIIAAFGVVWQLGYMRSIALKFISVVNPFARATSPLYESVAEHRITAWSSMYYEFGIGIIFFIAGFFFLIRNINDNKYLFLILAGLTSLYFACSMVRLFIIAAPFFGLIASIGIMGILRPFNTLIKETPRIPTKKKYSLEFVGKEYSGIAILLIFIILTTNFAFAPQYGGMPKVYRQAYAPVTISAASLSLVPNEPIRAWIDTLEWVRNNLSPTTVVCSWWDYGYWLTIVGNVTTLADNATVNVTQIGLIGRVFMSNEKIAVKILKEQFNGPWGPPKYILLYLTFFSNGQDAGFGGDDGKWMWMARIANSSDYARELYKGEFSWEYKEWGPNRQYTTLGNYTESGFEWNTLGQNTTFYKLMQNAKYSLLGQTVSAPALVYFKNPEFFGGIVGQAGEDSQGNPIYLFALICLYEIDYEAS